MSRPAVSGAAASAVTPVNESPSSSRNWLSWSLSRATPTTRAPAWLSDMAMLRPKPRLAPVTSAVAPTMEVGVKDM